MEQQRSFTEELQSQMNAEGVPKESFSKMEKLITDERVEGTAFTIKGSEETGYVIKIGYIIVSKKYDTQEQAEEAIDRGDWNVIMAVIQALIHLRERELLDMTAKNIVDIEEDKTEMPAITKQP